MLHLYSKQGVLNQNYYQLCTEYLLRCGLFKEDDAFIKVRPLISQLIIGNSTLIFARQAVDDGKRTI